MAQPIQDPTVGVTLQKLFSLQGRVRPALEEFIIPTVVVADLSPAAAPPIRRRAGAFNAHAAVVGEFFTLRFEMPATTFAVVRRIMVSAAVGGDLLFNFPGNAATLAALASTAGKSFIDGRLLPGAPSGAQLPAGVVTSGTQAAALTPTPFAWPRATGEVSNIEPTGWVVGGFPSLTGFLEMQLDVANTGVAWSLEWDEYQLV